jgi:shikimate dehydrogenase
MKLGLLGFPLEHSRSPQLYKDLLGKSLESYELFSYPEKNVIPDISFFQSKLDGLSITSPFKDHFIHQVNITSDLVKKLGLINTIAFSEKEVFATNTDLLAVEDILEGHLKRYPKLHIHLLGDGAMAKVTLLVAKKFQIPVEQHSRRLSSDFFQLSLPRTHKGQSLIINTCSREYIFKGALQGDEIFWDYNYSMRPHLESLPKMVKTYQDGLELLEKQARYAINFWSQYNSKLSSE